VEEFRPWLLLAPGLALLAYWCWQLRARRLRLGRFNHMVLHCARKGVAERAVKLTYVVDAPYTRGLRAALLVLLAGGDRAAGRAAFDAGFAEGYAAVRRLRWHAAAGLGLVALALAWQDARIALGAAGAAVVLLAVGAGLDWQLGQSRRAYPDIDEELAGLAGKQAELARSR